MVLCRSALPSDRQTMRRPLRNSHGCLATAGGNLTCSSCGLLPLGLADGLALATAWRLAGGGSTVLPPAPVGFRDAAPFK
jgi:hypothetical protein